MLFNNILNYKLDSVSGVIPTYNRKLFIPNILKIWLRQNYDIFNRELIIIDDSDEFFGDKIKWNNIPGFISYYYSSKKLNLGYKRNLLNRLSNGIWIISYDDDDYYFEDRIKYSINELKKNNKLLGGSSELYIYSPINEYIYKSKYYGKNHATNATFIYNFMILLDTKYNNLDKYGEEKYFLKNYTLDICQLDSLKIIIVIAHLCNTIDKYKFINNFIKTDLICKNLLSNDMINFFNDLIFKQLN